MSLNLPKTFTMTRVSPTIEELQFMHKWCTKNVLQKAKILEFGAGPTTWAIHKAVNPSLYVAVEDWPSTVKDVMNHLSDVKIVKSTWFDIPEEEYDFIFVDSSAGYPPKSPGLHRDEAAKYGERLLKKGGFIMLHDWRKRSGKGPRQYLESNGYKLVDSLRGRTGVGVYQYED